MYLLGTDIGTGSIKTVAVDFSGNVLDSSQYYYPSRSPQPGYSEQEPDEVYTAFIQSIREIVSKNEGSAGSGFLKQRHARPDGCK